MRKDIKRLPFIIITALIAAASLCGCANKKEGGYWTVTMKYPIYPSPKTRIKPYMLHIRSCRAFFVFNRR